MALKKISFQISEPQDMVESSNGSAKMDFQKKSKVVSKGETIIEYLQNGNITTQIINGNISKYQSIIENDTVVVVNLLTGEMIEKKYSDLIDAEMKIENSVYIEKDINKKDAIKLLIKIPANQLRNVLVNDTKIGLHSGKSSACSRYDGYQNYVESIPEQYTLLHEIGHSYFPSIESDRILQNIWEKEYIGAAPFQKKHSEYFGLYHEKEMGLSEICAELNVIINSVEPNSDYYNKKVGIRMQQLMEVYPKTCKRIIELLYH